MTVNELIAELQVLVAQGHGDLDVVTNCIDESVDTNLIVKTQSRCYWTSEKSWSNREKPTIVLATKEFFDSY